MNYSKILIIKSIQIVLDGSFSRGISSVNLLMKAQSVNTVVSVVNNHRYRFFPPTKPEIEEQWKLIRKALWTTISLEGRKIAKHKISHDKVMKVVENGGLVLIHSSQAATTSLISSLARVYRHIWENDTSILNML